MDLTEKMSAKSDLGVDRPGRWLGFFSFFSFSSPKGAGDVMV